MEIPNSRALAELSAKQILEIFADISDTGTPIIIPIAFPNAGKSMFLSSLLYSGSEFGDRSGFLLQPLTSRHYKNGSGTTQHMINAFVAKKAYRRNVAGTLDIIGTKLEPHSANRNSQEFALVDLSGEDIKRLISDEEDGTGVAEFTDPKLQAILNGCAEGNTIFCLITPFMPQDGDAKENELHGRFLTYIESEYPALFQNSKFIVVVAQWDKVPANKKITPIEYIQNNRRILYNKLVARNTNVVYTEYSVGTIVNTEDENNVPVAVITRINTVYPSKLWNHFYKQTTGNDIISISWWDKILIFLGFKDSQ